MRSVAVEERNYDQDCRGRQIVRTSELIPKSKSMNPNGNMKSYHLRNAVSQGHNVGVILKKDNERHMTVNRRGVPVAPDVDDLGKLFFPSRNGVEELQPLNASKEGRTRDQINVEACKTVEDEQIPSESNSSHGKIYNKMQNIIFHNEKSSIENVDLGYTVEPQEYHGKWLVPRSESSDDITTKYQSEPDSESLESSDNTSRSDLDLWQLPSEVHKNGTVPYELDFQHLLDGISRPRSEQPDALRFNEPTWKNISRTQQKILDFKELLYEEKDGRSTSSLSRKLGKSLPRNSIYDHNIKLQYEAINTEYLQIRLRFSNWGTLQNTKKAKNDEDSPNYGIGLLGYIERLKDFPPRMLAPDNAESSTLESDPYHLQHYIANMWDEEINTSFFSNA